MLLHGQEATPSRTRCSNACRQPSCNDCATTQHPSTGCESANAACRSASGAMPHACTCRVAQILSLQGNLASCVPSKECTVGRRSCRPRGGPPGVSGRPGPPTRAGRAAPRWRGVPGGAGTLAGPPAAAAARHSNPGRVRHFWHAAGCCAPRRAAAR